MPGSSDRTLLRRSAQFALLWIATTFVATAQVSPGPLSRAHENLEGITHCTDCHVRGEQVGMQLCLTCHTDIRASIARKTGMHAKSSEESCANCHKEHLGVDAAITRFDPNTFDHKSTGFSLIGAHASLACDRCHRTERVKLDAVKKFKRTSGKGTFLGLDSRCISCHADRHRGKLASDCSSCHGPTAWKPATGFAHDRTKFRLTGKHTLVQCVSCHPKPDQAAAPILFTTKTFAACTPCHTSPHPKGFGGGRACSGCHTTEGWKEVANFDHSVTRFTLVGRHASVPCVKCHAGMEKTGADTKVRFAAKPFSDCTPCHASPHGPGFSGKACTSCHSPQSWSAGDRSTFDHGITRFVLTDAHTKVACEKCHVRTVGGSFTDVFRTGPRACASCHTDPHGGVFAKRYANDCAACHSVRTFVPASFSLAMHDSTRFPLTGAHKAVPCGPCHRSKERATLVFTFSTVRCDACHADHHKGQFSNQMRVKSCAQCHSTASWNMRTFDHSGTQFPLVGRHIGVTCAKCHKPDARGVVKYVGTSTTCASCHSDVHRGQFDSSGGVECQQCHTATGWTELVFRHDLQSRFALTGAHQRVACGGCHRPERAGDTTFVRFKPLAVACESCHQKQ